MRSIEMINAAKLRLNAIDEAHCISEGGHAGLVVRKVHRASDRVLALTNKYDVLVARLVRVGAERISLQQQAISFWKCNRRKDGGYPQSGRRYMCNFRDTRDF